MDANTQVTANALKCMETLESRSLFRVIAKKRNCSEEHVQHVLSSHFQLISSVNSDDADEYTWVNHLDKGSDCDLNLMQAAISDLTFDSSVCVLPVTFAQELLKRSPLLHASDTCIDIYDIKRDTVFSDLASSLRAKVGKPQNNSHVFIPTIQAQYWGCVVITFNSTATKALIQWGDVIRGSVSPPILSFISCLFQNAFSNVECSVDDAANYMLDVRLFEQQKGTQLSGFFILQLLASHAQSSRYFPVKDWPKYEADQIEEIRDACAASYIHHLLDLYADKPNGLVVKKGDMFEYLLSSSRPGISNPIVGRHMNQTSKIRQPIPVDTPFSPDPTQNSRIVKGNSVGSVQFVQPRGSFFHDKETMNVGTETGATKTVTASKNFPSRGIVETDAKLTTNLSAETALKTVVISKAGSSMEENEKRASITNLNIDERTNKDSDSGVRVCGVSLTNGNAGEISYSGEAVNITANANKIKCAMIADVLVDSTTNAASNECKGRISKKTPNILTERRRNGEENTGEEEEKNASQVENSDESADGANDEKPNTTVFVRDIVQYFKDLASQGFFFGNTSHQGLKGRSTRGQLYRAYIQLRCIKYPGDNKHGIPRCPAKLRFDKLREQDGWHASLFSEHSHPPLPETLRSRRESQVIQTLRDMQMWYLPKDISLKLAGQITNNCLKGSSYGDKSDNVEQRSVAEKILPRPPHMQPVFVPHVRPINSSSEQLAREQLAIHQTQQHVIPHPLQPHAGVQLSHSQIPTLPAHKQQSVPVTIHANHLNNTSQPQELAVLHPEQPSIFPFSVKPDLEAQRAPVPIAPRDIGRDGANSTDGHVTLRSSLHDTLSTSVPNPMYNGSSFPLSTPNLSVPDSSTRLTATSNIDCDGTGVQLVQTHKLPTVNKEVGKNLLEDIKFSQNAAKLSTKMIAEGMPDTHTNGFGYDASVGKSSTPGPMAGVFRSNGEDLVAVKNGGATLALVEAIRAYVNTSHLKLVENEMAHHIKKIAEQCGFKLRIRRSMYHAGEENVFIKSATFECAQKVRNGCPFAFRLRGHLKRRRCNGSSEEGVLGSEKGSETKQNQVVYSTSVNFLGLEHNHEHDNSLLQKHLAQPTSNSIKQIISLAREDSVTVGSVIRQVEKKHSFIVPRASLRKRIEEERETRDPLARQCNGLVARLIELKNKDPSIFVHSSPEGPQNTLSRICWSFPEWQKDYMDHGRIPGIYVDTQDLAGLFKLPLVSINGRTNTGDTAVFFVAFIADKNEGSMKWLFEQFKTCMFREKDDSPKIIAVEQHPAMIDAARSVFLSSWLVFDEERLKQHEKENVRDFLEKMDMMHMAEELRSRLHKLREAESREEFIFSRKVIENAYFSQLSGDNKIPPWFMYLYYTEKDLAIHCFNRRSCGLQFAFNGISYALSSFSSIHKLCVEDTSVESCKVPEVLRQAANARRLLQAHKRKEVNNSLVDELVDTGMYNEKFRIQLGLPFVRVYTEFCVHYLTKMVVPKADEWQTVQAGINPNQDENDSVKKVTFNIIRHSSNEPGDVEAIPGSQREIALIWRRSPLAGGSLEFICECNVAKTAGMPCEHILAVIRSFNSESGLLQKERAYLALSVLPLYPFVHDYWKRDLNAWRALIPRIRFEGLSSENLQNRELDNVTFTNQFCEPIQKESQCHVEYVANKRLFENAWSVVKSMGDKQRATFHSIMKHMVDFCHQCHVPLIPTSGNVAQNEGENEKPKNSPERGNSGIEPSQSMKRAQCDETLFSTQQKRPKNSADANGFTTDFERSEMTNDAMEIGCISP